jgi:hypothetical protein
MKPEKLSIIGASIGIFTIFVYTWKYLIYYEFLSMWLVGCGIGVILIVFSYIYSWMKDMDRKIKEFNGKFEGMTKWFIKEELQ